MAVFASEKSSKDINSNGIVSDDAVVASDVPPQYLFLFFLPIHILSYVRASLKRVRPSVNTFGQLEETLLGNIKYEQGVF